MSDAHNGSGPRPATLLAQAGHFVDPATGAVVPPIHPATTYARTDDYAVRDGCRYSRDDNPGYGQVETVLARLEGGADALVFGSGVAAAQALLATLKPGDHMVAPTWAYHGVRKWIVRHCAHYGIELDLFDARQPDALEAAVRPGATRLVWIETPANPTWTVTDIELAAQAAHDAGARLVVDATVLTPVLCQPLAFGADYVLHSATKYLNGHSDVVAGALVTASADDAWQEVCAQRAGAGAVLGPFEAWLLLRGMRTLHLRMERVCANAMAIARHFAGHPALAEVLYPGLASHPGHGVAARQQNTTVGFGGMLSFRLKGGAAAAVALATATRLFLPATSLGGTESLIEHRKTIEGDASPVPDDLVRLSVGIEDAGDLIADLEQALDGVE